MNWKKLFEQKNDAKAYKAQIFFYAYTGVFVIGMALLMLSVADNPEVADIKIHNMSFFAFVAVIMTLCFGILYISFAVSSYVSLRELHKK